MVESIIKEIEIRSHSLKEENKDETAILSSPNEAIDTIYFGGGTPSLLLKEELLSIITAIYKNYSVAKNAEITLEANPDDIDSINLSAWKKSGVNRLSIGIQSFIDRDLSWMNRAHNSHQAFTSIALSKEAGFENFSIDLIFGTPGLTDKEWKENILKAIELNVPHISSYALTVEPKTALAKMIQLNKKQNINNDKQANQFLILMETMRKAGYEHYEISNFAKPGFRSRHNSSYWQSKKYLGFGPSAHSYNGKERLWNKAKNVYYLKSIEQNIIPYEKETLTEAQKLNEYIMTSLRTIEGMDLNFIDTTFSQNEKIRIENLLKNKVEKENYFKQKEKIILSDKGKLLADAIAVELFV